MASNIVHRETWVHRVKLVREHCAHLLGDEGWRWRVLRTSNAYSFNDPKCSEVQVSGRNRKLSDGERGIR